MVSNVIVLIVAPPLISSGWCARGGAILRLLLALLIAGCVTTQSTFEERLDEAIAIAGPRAQISIVYRDLGSGSEWVRNDRVAVHAASTMKVPVMMALFEALNRGELQGDQLVPVRNSFTSILDGSTYELVAGEDSDPELYAHVGRAVPLEELMQRMIVRSSNLATNLLMEFVGAPRIMELMRSIGANESRILRGVQDIKAFDAGMNNMVTARDLAIVLQHIARGKSPMIDILAAQEFNSGIPAGLPPGTRVAHKTGNITAHYHDAAIVYPPGSDPYVLVVLTKDAASEPDAVRAVAAVSRLFWERHQQRSLTVR
jgi:beta-lactamase class A